MHVMGDDLNCTGRSLLKCPERSKLQLKYFSNRSCSSHHQCLILFAVEQPFIIDSIAFLKRTS